MQLAKKEQEASEYRQLYQYDLLFLRVTEI